MPGDPSKSKPAWPSPIEVFDHAGFLFAPCKATKVEAEETAAWARRRGHPAEIIEEVVARW